ncbi:hypothetical protein [Methylobacterium frigidaeris]|uniref:Uncharacterized protein n=1 Tax=Methylobacterium frigidaeris TaxID=2038277 RepID=A0AA37H740_9HYPH|nr:hypothetical protein [Methylobacterium frigidaeris]PIK71478.1 hypothetical protein CS379_19095 [Methylobacterium frigidaeris]GJD60090.1 hypothetical protein MPEAHAMD_0225 [Methylobacterium frigidaeris]
MPRHDDTHLSAPTLRGVRPPARPQAPADRLAEHLIEAYRHAAECEDPVALDLIRLALWHVGRTYSPSAAQAAEEHWS